VLKAWLCGASIPLVVFGLLYIENNVPIVEDFTHRHIGYSKLSRWITFLPAAAAFVTSFLAPRFKIALGISIALPAVFFLHPAVLQLCYYEWFGFPSEIEKLWELPRIGVGYTEGLLLAAVSSATGASLGYIVSMVYRIVPG